MDKIKKIFENSFMHHAYGFESHGLLIDDIQSCVPKNSFEYIFSRHYDFLKINDVRSLRALQSEKTREGSLFIISFVHINIEAQNALLKIIEEPTPNTIFFFIFPQAQILLPTLQSRLYITRLNTLFKKNNSPILLKDFLEMNLQECFEYIKKHTGKKTKKELLINKQNLQFFLDDLEIFYIQQKSSKKRNNILRSLIFFRKYLYTNGASLKMILETLAIQIHS